MNNRENLVNLIQQTELTKAELRKKIYPYLQKVNDIMVVKSIAEEVLSGKLDSLSDQDVNELITILGGVPQVEENKVETQEEKTEEINNALQDSYNTVLIEIEELRKTTKKLKDKNEQLENQKKELADIKDELIKDNTALIERITKLERIADTLLKYNITETKELIEVEDEDINQLYFKYSKEGITEFNNAILIENVDQIIIPKTYYRFEKEGD